MEAAEISADCRRARDRLLLGHQDWPGSAQDAKRQWIRFLDVIGVSDGLGPTEGQLTRRGSPAYLWDSLLRYGKASEGLDEDWCAEVGRVSFNHPYTDYELRGQLWRLPGQVELDQLPESAAGPTQWGDPLQPTVFDYWARPDMQRRASESAWGRH